VPAPEPGHRILVSSRDRRHGGHRPDSTPLVALILDTGPVYASLDRSDKDHKRCRELIESSAEVLVIPGSVLLEVDYLVSK
jgi:hypothetical protein